LSLQNDDEDEEVFAAAGTGDEFPPQSFETVDIMMQPQGIPSYEPGIKIAYNDPYEAINI